jgi:hypothetical protein
MTTLRRTARGGAATLVLIALGACSSLGNLGNVLGGALGSPQGQVSGWVQGVDTRAQQIVLQQSDGQTVALLYDNQTQVVYQNQSYPVTALERGDQITARIQATSTGAYYTDLVQVDQSASGPGGSSGSVQALQGTVRGIDRTNGLFAVDAGNLGTLTVSMPYNPSRADLNRFQSLRIGDYVRFYGVFLNNARVELRQFY